MLLLLVLMLANNRVMVFDSDVLPSSALARTKSFVSEKGNDGPCAPFLANSPFLSAHNLQRMILRYQIL